MTFAAPRVALLRFRTAQYPEAARRSAQNVGNVRKMHLEYPMVKVPVGRFQKQFEHFRALAHREAVTITSDGRDDVVLLSAKEYHRLRNLDRRSMHVSEFGDDELRAIVRVEILADAS
jgi:hypothetical protein